VGVILPLVQTFAVSLLRSPQRRRHIVRELDRFGQSYEVIDAVDGLDLDLEDSRLLVPSTVVADPPGFTAVHGSWCGLGTIGCTLSHLAIYRRILDEGHDVALVVEDDARLSRKLPVVLDRLRGRVTGAAVVLLHFEGPEPVQLSSAQSVKLTRSIRLTYPVVPSQVRSAMAYLITADACERILAYNVPLKCEIDWWGGLHAAGVIDGLGCVTPMPVKLETRLVSDRSLADGVIGRGWRGRFVQRVSTSRTPPFYQLLAIRRHFLLRPNIRYRFVDFESPCTIGCR
jgi:glycosyl transferase family 25